MFAAATTNQASRFPALQERRRPRRGSLPLKKRRVNLDLNLESSSSSSLTQTSSSPFFTYKPATFHKLQHQDAESADAYADAANNYSSSRYQLALLPTHSIMSSNRNNSSINNSNTGFYNSSANATGYYQTPHPPNNSSHNNDHHKLSALSLIAAVAASASCAPSASSSSMDPHEATTNPRGGVGLAAAGPALPSFLMSPQQ